LIRRGSENKPCVFEVFPQRPLKAKPPNHLIFYDFFEIQNPEATTGDAMKNLSILTGALFVAAIAGSTAQAQTFVRKPFLQLGSHNKASVCWRTSAAAALTVRFGTDSTNLNRLTAPSASNVDACAQLDTLLPNTKYFYQVYNGTTLLPGTSTQYVKTAPIPGTKTQKYTFWAIGDFGTGLEPQANVRNAFVRVNGSPHVDGVLMLGDNAYEQGTDAQHTSNIFAMYPDILSNSFAWPAIGNHEAMTSSGTPHLAAWYLPSQGQSGGVASNSEYYYSFNHGNIHFVVLDSEVSSRTTTGAQYLWLAQDLQASTNADWLVVTFHHPPYTRGSHNSETEAKHVDMRYNIMPLLEQYGVDLVFGGHSHDYERSFLIDSARSVTGTTLATHNTWFTQYRPRYLLDSSSGDPFGTGPYRKKKGGRQGTVYNVVGSSGKLESITSLHPVMRTQIFRHGSSILDFEDSVVTVRFIDSAGVLRDRYQIVKSSALVGVRDAAGKDSNPLRADVASFHQTGRFFRFAADNADPLRVFALNGRLLFEGIPRGSWEATRKAFPAGDYYFRHGAALGKITLP
jgi:hypothetical protein